MRMSVVLMIRWCWYKDNVDTMMMQSFYDDDDTTTFDQSIWGQTWHSKAFVFQRMSRRHWHVVPARDGSAAFQIGWIFWESRGGKLAKRTDVPILCLFSSDLRPICKFSDKRISLASVHILTTGFSCGCSCSWHSDSWTISRSNLRRLPDTNVWGIFFLAQSQSWHNPNLQTKLTSFAWHSALESHRTPSILLRLGSGATNPSWNVLLGCTSGLLRWLKF